MTKTSSNPMAEINAIADACRKAMFKLPPLPVTQPKAPMQTQRLCDDCRTEIDSGYLCRSCANFEARTFGDGDDS